jgi:hypothetical protein
MRKYIYASLLEVKIFRPNYQHYGLIPISNVETTHQYNSPYLFSRKKILRNAILHNHVKSFLVATFIFFLGFAFNMAQASSLNVGPFNPNPSLAFYWLNRPATCTASLQLSLINKNNPETALIRVYDRDNISKEYLSFSQTITLAAGSSATAVPLKFSSLILPITEIRVSTGSNNLSVTVVPTCSVPDYGVAYQNGVNSAWASAPASLFAFIPWGSEPLTIQNHSSTSFTIIGVDASGNESDSTGPVGGKKTISSSETATVTPSYVSWQGTGHSNVVWEFTFPANNWNLSATGFPLILCSDYSAAITLQAAMIFDGTHMFAHPTQYSIVHTLIPGLAKYVGSASTESSLLSNISNQKQMLQFPNSYLLSGWAAIYDLAYTLANQNLLSGSDWYGSSAGWQHRDPSPNNTTTPIVQPTGTVSWLASGALETGPLIDPQRWARAAAALVDGVAPEMEVEASTDDGTATSGLIYLATIDGSKSPVPWSNPYLYNKSLVYQAIITGLKDLAALPSSEVWNNSSTMLSTYAGGEIAFLSARKIFLNYGRTGFLLRRLFCASSPTPNEQTLYNCTQINNINPMSAAELTAWNFSASEITLLKTSLQAWTFLAERFAYRMWPNNLVSYRNQSSHMVYSFQLLADGSGSSFDQTLAKSYAQRWIAGQDPAGWFMESEGPDGAYNGMSDYHIGSYYLDTCQMGSCDSAMASSIAKAYDFFSYTVAPEPVSAIKPIPDASAPETSTQILLGGFPFNHRVGQGFDMEFWGGARGIANTIPEVSAWNPIYNAPPTSVPVFSAAGSQNGDFNTNRYIGVIAYPPVAGTPWPAQSTSDFTTNVNNAGEMIAVKRQGYYTVLYLAHPATNEVYIVGINTPNERLAWENGAESTGCQIGDPDGNWNTPFVGGGVTLFWTPDFGSSILAGTWTPLAHHGLVVTDGQSGVRTWEDYFTPSYTLSSNDNVLTVNGDLETPGPTTALHIQPIVNESYSKRSTCGYPAPSSTAPQSNVNGLSYSRQYTFGEDAMTVNLNVTASTAAVIPSGTTMIENIPITGGTTKQGTTGQPEFYLPSAPSTPIANNTTVSTQEIDIHGNSASTGIRIVFKTNQNVTVVSNGPISEYKNYQINRLQLAMTVPAAGQTSNLQYCVESLSQRIADCGF